MSSEAATETKSQNKKIRKGERPGFDKVVAIHLYPDVDDIPEKLDDTEEAVFNIKRDARKSSKDKTNLMELRINKIEHLMDNAEAYCKLLNRLNNDKWSREEDVDVFKKARDLNDCIHTKCVYTYVAAIDQFASKLADRAEARMKLMADRMDYSFTAENIRNGGMWGLEELFQDYGGEIADAIYSVADWKKGEERLERDFWDLIARLVFRESHRAYEVQYEYLMHDVRKPYNVDFMNFKRRMEQVFSYLPMFPIKSMRGSIPEPADYELQRQPIEEQKIREAIFNALPKKWQDEFERRENQDYRVLEDSQFIDIMLKIEEQDKAERATFEATKTAGKRQKNDRGGGNTSPKKKPRVKKLCNKCKQAGRSEAAYTSHDESACTFDPNRKKSADNNNNGGKKSAFQIMQKQMLTMTKQLEKLTKKRKRKGSSDESDGSDSS